MRIEKLIGEGIIEEEDTCMKFSKVAISDVPIEEAHGGSGARQVLVKPEHMTSPFFEAITKGFLKSGAAFDWHVHKDTDEIFIVLKEKGKFYCEDEVIEYRPDDTFITPSDLNHKIEATEDSEFYFIRIKNK